MSEDIIKEKILKLTKELYAKEIISDDELDATEKCLINNFLLEATLSHLKGYTKGMHRKKYLKAKPTRKLKGFLLD